MLLVALGTTVIATAYVAREAKARDASRFESAVAEARNDVTAQLETYIGYLRAGAGLVAARPDVTRDEWRAFVGRMQIGQASSGLLGIGFSRRLTSAAAAEAALAELHARVGPHVRLYPPHDGAERHAIVYLEPLDARNERALGYDMLTEPTRHEAMSRARDTAQPAASGKVHLVQDAAGPRPQAGFLIYMPVYATGNPPASVKDRAAQLVGFVYIPLRVDDLMNAAFGGRTTSTVRFDVYDGEELRPDDLLHRAPRGGSGGEDYAPRRTARQPLFVAGRKWTLDFASVPRFDLESGRDLRPIVLLVGGLLSLVLFGLTRSQ